MQMVTKRRSERDKFWKRNKDEKGMSVAENRFERLVLHQRVIVL